MKAILVDDEPMALDVLEHMLTPYEKIKIVGSYTQHIDALKDVEKTKPDVIFLDIEMGDMNGLELAEVFMQKLNNVDIVFVTAYSQYAVEAFEVNAIDYLLKPVQEKRLSKAIGRLEEKNKEIAEYSDNIQKTLNSLNVSSFGGFQVTDNKERALSWRTQKSKELFAYLWMKKEKPSSKDIIIDSIFPDRKIEKASTLLHTTIYQLRKSLEKLGYSNAIVYLEEGYRLDIFVKSDIEFIKELKKQKNYSEEDIQEIFKIYKGDFLEEGYPWAIEEQQRYRQIVFDILEEFVKKEIHSKKFSLIFKMALDKLYEIDPFNDLVAEWMIIYYGKQGKLIKLKNFLNTYKEVLWQEMRLKPTKRIINIYNEYI